MMIPVKREITPERIKAARVALGQSQQEAATEIGVSVSAWAHWEQGVARPMKGPVRIALEGYLTRAEATEK